MSNRANRRFRLLPPEQRAIARQQRRDLLRFASGHAPVVFDEVATWKHFVRGETIAEAVVPHDGPRATLEVADVDRARGIVTVKPLR